MSLLSSKNLRVTPQIGKTYPSRLPNFFPVADAAFFVLCAATPAAFLVDWLAANAAFLVLWAACLVLCAALQVSSNVVHSVTLVLCKIEDIHSRFTWRICSLCRGLPLPSSPFLPSFIFIFVAPPGFTASPASLPPLVRFTVLLFLKGEIRLCEVIQVDALICNLMRYDEKWCDVMQWP